MCKTIKQKVRFRAHPKQIYELLTDEKKHKAFTRHKATISKKIGGKFSTYSGHCQGIVVDLAPGKRIVQAWRTKNFPTGIFSMATFHLTKIKTGTELTLVHRGVPKDLIPGVERGWRQFYWEKMKKYLGADK
jgi:activator of HSP90 ATPase